jgi:hypothetical protein
VTDAPIRAAQDVGDVGPEVYALPTDGPKGKSLRKKRKLLAFTLAIAANPDGSSITLCIETMMERTGESRATVFRLLDDLKTLGFLEDGKLTRFNGTRRRTLRVDRILAAAAKLDLPVQVSNTNPVGVSNSSDRSLKQDSVGVSNSISYGSQIDSAGVTNGNVGVSNLSETLPLPTASPPPPHRLSTSSQSGAPKDGTHHGKDGEGRGISSSKNPTLADYENVIRRLPNDVKNKTVGKWKKEIKQAIEEWGSEIFIDAVTRWSEKRPMSVPNLAWQFFFSGEHVTYLDEARHAAWEKLRKESRRRG